MMSIDAHPVHLPALPFHIQRRPLTASQLFDRVAK